MSSRCRWRAANPWAFTGLLCAHEIACDSEFGSAECGNVFLYWGLQVLVPSYRRASDSNLSSNGAESVYRVLRGVDPLLYPPRSEGRECFVAPVCRNQCLSELPAGVVLCGAPDQWDKLIAPCVCSYLSCVERGQVGQRGDDPVDQSTRCGRKRELGRGKACPSPCPSAPSRSPPLLTMM